MNFSERLQKLNIIEKLLKSELVSVKLSLGEEIVVRGINEEIKQFLLASMESTFTGESTAQFTPQEVLVLKEFVGKVLAKAANPLPSVKGLTPSVPPPEPPKPPRRSPVLEALAQQGFNPKATVEERKAAIKSIEKKK